MATQDLSETPKLVERGERAGSIGMVLLVAFGLIAAAVGFLLIGRNNAQPYVLAFLAVYNRQILFAKVPGAGVPVHVPAHWEVGLVWGFNLALVLTTWEMTKRYTESLRPATPGGPKSAGW